MTDTMQKVVQDGVAAFAAFDAWTVEGYDKIEAIRAVIRRGVALSMVGGITGKRMLNEVMELTGALGALGTAAADLHTDCTAAAQANGVDTGQMTRAAGVTILGGGTR